MNMITNKKNYLTFRIRLTYLTNFLLFLFSSSLRRIHWHQLRQDPIWKTHLVLSSNQEHIEAQTPTLGNQYQTLQHSI